VATPRSATLTDLIDREGKMETRVLGRTGVRVSTLCLGTMMFGAQGNPDHDDSIKVIHAALDAGINFIDTADVYSRGESETIVGKALSGTRRDEVILASKFHGSMGEGPNQGGNSRRWIIQAVEASLRRLDTDWLDLYQIHRFDPDTDIEETLGALDDLVHQGKVRYVGTSVFSPSQLVQAQWTSQRRVLVRPSTEQSPYSLLVRGVESEVLPVAEQYGLGVLTYGPLAAGWLSGRYRLNAGQPASHRSELIPGRFDVTDNENHDKLVAADSLASLAEESGVSLIHLAIGFVLSHRAVTSAIIGPRVLEHLQSQLGGSEVHLSSDILDRIDQIVPPGTNFRLRDSGAIPTSLTDSRRRRFT
jgi:aryl-alcohol dehydrogenase-like predicted oxidoreductase